MNHDTIAYLAAVGLFFCLGYLFAAGAFARF